MDKIAENAMKLAGLLADPHLGLAVWHEMRLHVAKELFADLCDALGVSSQCEATLIALLWRLDIDCKDVSFPPDAFPTVRAKELIEEHYGKRNAP